MQLGGVWMYQESINECINGKLRLNERNISESI